jgi:hypothetical protein
VAVWPIVPVIAGWGKLLSFHLVPVRMTRESFAISVRVYDRHGCRQTCEVGGSVVLGYNRIPQGFRRAGLRRSGRPAVVLPARDGRQLDRRMVL